MCEKSPVGKSISAEICILGAGPAGLAAAWELAQRGLCDVVVLDRNASAGGLARTEAFEGSRFDVGPHRFFTANQEVLGLWRGLLGGELRPVRRLTRILYGERFYRYPIRAADALLRMGPIEAAAALLSYIRAKAHEDPFRAESFEQWVRARFGQRLYRRFFEAYTEKVWGVPCSLIAAEWSAQRIKGLDLVELLRRALGWGSGRRPKTLSEEFDYPRRGAGAMYERMAEILAARGVRFYFGVEVDRVERRQGRIETACAGGLRVEAGRYISSLPVTRLLQLMRPAPDADVLSACRSLLFRDHLCVDLCVEASGLFADQWIYIHSPELCMARVVNYRNFSPHMAARPGLAPLGVEYFTFGSPPGDLPRTTRRADALWHWPDTDVIQLAADELEAARLIPRGSVFRGRVRRERDAYPVYLLGYREPFERVRRAVAGLGNLYPVGRGGLFRYNNMDHAIYSGLLVARNLLAGEEIHDPYRINADAEYQEAAARID
ncbi:MAG: FAD-dependent oxidoreductase [Deltaproteobacteria bacterium]|nr:FAD-dependent oxidoreductase [Deltaproteobacteria bacterium]